MSRSCERALLFGCEQRVVRRRRHGRHDPVVAAAGFIAESFGDATRELEDTFGARVDRPRNRRIVTATVPAIVAVQARIEGRNDGGVGLTGKECGPGEGRHTRDQGGDHGRPMARLHPRLSEALEAGSLDVRLMLPALLAGERQTIA